ncbi:hypothetical protein WJX75_003475 [Coccomyxa subellipsoidea]|uniref:Calcineurin-like phosphoesterase domain-containing protein n=1 Tax=Coccomyxa subellipsoidea TaxID=248742 RepID=A0ABR2Z365_9CHLO
MRTLFVAAAILLLTQSCSSAEKDFSTGDDKLQETIAPSGSSLPPPSTQAPNYLNPKVSADQANNNEPLVEQAGSPALFPSTTNSNFNLGPGTSRYLVIGDWGRTTSGPSVGLDQCTTDEFAGDNEVQGGLQQAETAQLADQVCGLLGGCQAVIGTGDNFYECGVHPADTTNRFQLDWANIFQTSKTPNLQGLTWYQTFGNHDMVINGSVETQIAYTTTNPKWQIPSNYFLVDLPTVAGGPKIRAFFVDTNPFIASYNVAGQKYKKAYFQAHLNSAYIDGQISWLTTNLAASKADYNIVIERVHMASLPTLVDRTTATSPPTEATAASSS